MDKCQKTAALYLATLKAMTLIHQQSHWLSKGNDFYGNHLLFQRIYESAQENLDGAAEKFIGLFDLDCENFALQNDLLSKILKRYEPLCNNPVEASLKLEKDFINLSDAAYKCFETEDKMSQGLDDFMMATASAREEAIYLLQQASKN